MSNFEVTDIVEQSAGTTYSTVGFLADQIGQRLLRDGYANITVDMRSFVIE